MTEGTDAGVGAKVGFGDRTGDGMCWRIEFELSTLGGACVMIGEGATGDVRVGWYWFADELTMCTSRPRRRKSSCISA